MDARVATAPRWNGAPQAAPLTIRRNDANNSAHLAGLIALADSVAMASAVLFLPGPILDTRKVLEGMSRRRRPGGCFQPSRLRQSGRGLPPLGSRSEMAEPYKTLIQEWSGCQRPVKSSSLVPGQPDWRSLHVFDGPAWMSSFSKGTLTSPRPGVGTMSGCICIP
jgi:hypothetical protein